MRDISRPVQKLYPIEVKSVIQGNGQVGHGVQRQRNTPLRCNPSRSAALGILDGKQNVCLARRRVKGGRVSRRISL